MRRGWHPAALSLHLSAIARICPPKWLHKSIVTSCALPLLADRTASYRHAIHIGRANFVVQLERFSVHNAPWRQVPLNTAGLVAMNSAGTALLMEQLRKNLRSEQKCKSRAQTLPISGLVTIDTFLGPNTFESSKTSSPSRSQNS